MVSCSWIKRQLEVLKFSSALVAGQLQSFLDAVGRWQTVGVIAAFLVAAVAWYLEHLPSLIGGLALCLLFAWIFLNNVYGNHLKQEEKIHGLEEDTRKQDEKIRELNTTRVELVFDPADMGCIDDPAIHTLYRVKVTNVGRVTIENVRVTMERFCPQGTHWPGLPLRFMRDISSDGRYSDEGYPINPGQSAYVNVVRKKKAGSEDDLHFLIEYAQSDFPNMIPARPYTFHLVAEGKNVMPSAKDFYAYVDGDGKFQFQQT